MPFTLTMPKLTPTMEGGTIVKWHQKEGDFVKANDLLFELATDKATVEYNAIDEGFLRKILINEGQDAVINQAIAIFTEKKDESIEAYQPKGVPMKQTPSEKKVQELPVEKTSTPQTVSVSKVAFRPEPPLEKYEFEFPTSPMEQLFASPLAKKLASEKGVDLSTVKGSGPNGRVMSRDLDLAAAENIATFGPAKVPHLKPGSYEEIALSPMRKAIGQRLQASKATIPHFYVSQSVNAKALMELREQLKAHNLKLTVNDFIIRATALALKEHPSINSGFNSDQDKIIRFQTVDIAIAVSIPDGLITPIIRHADYKNLGQLSQEARHLAGLAKEGKLKPEQYRGGSFTISNLGMFGVDEFIAVINPPQANILAVGGILDKPIVENNQVVPGKVMTLTLASDHRVVDGADAAKFMQTLKKLLESPAILLI